MKILVFSDSHFDVDTMTGVTKTENPDILMHLGDHISDAYRLCGNFMSIPAHIVRGNNDFGFESDEKTLIINNKRFFITHGHRYNVKNGLFELAGKVKRADVHITLFGHTHMPYIGDSDGIKFMNPGRIGRRSGGNVRSTYGVIRFCGGEFDLSICEAPL